MRHLQFTQQIFCSNHLERRIYKSPKSDEDIKTELISQHISSYLIRFQSTFLNSQVGLNCKLKCWPDLVNKSESDHKCACVLNVKRLAGQRRELFTNGSALQRLWFAPFQWRLIIAMEMDDYGRNWAAVGWSWLTIEKVVTSRKHVFG